MSFSDNYWNNDPQIRAYTASGEVDPGFGNGGVLQINFGAYDAVYSMLALTDGNLLVAGHGSDVSGLILHKYDSSGNLDSRFGEGGMVRLPFNSADFIELQQQTDGKQLIGLRTGYAGEDIVVARLNPNGQLDAGFGQNGIVMIDYDGTRSDIITRSMILQNDGKILLGGYSLTNYTGLPSQSDGVMARLLSDGSLDTAFGSGGFVRQNLGPEWEYVNNVVVTDDGTIFSINDYNGRVTLSRYNSAGLQDMTFGSQGKVMLGNPSRPITTILDQTGSLFIGGTSYDGRYWVASSWKFNPSGQLDSEFGSNGISFPYKGLWSYNNGFEGGVYTSYLQSDGKIIAAARVMSDVLLYRLDAQGNPDIGFSPAENTLNHSPLATEQGTVVLDPGVQIVDAELASSGSYAGSTLTLSRQDGSNALDVFSNSGTLSALNPGSFFAVDGMTIGRVTTNSNGTLVLSFNSNATQNLVNKAMQQIAYSNTSDAPPATVAIDWTFNDGNTGAQGTGGALSVTGTSYVTITPTNDAPYVAANVPDQRVEVNALFSYQLPVGTFIDPDLETLSYSVTMADGTGVPPWLTFNRATQTFSGTPSADDVGSFEIQIKATDAAGASANDYVRFTVAVNTPPTMEVSFLPEPTGRNGMTVSIDSFQPINLGNGYTEYRVSYTEKNLTSSVIDQATLRLYFETGEPVAHYGFFGTVLPGEAYQTTRSYGFVVESNRVPTYLQYDADHFFSSAPIEGALQWRVNGSSLTLESQAGLDPAIIQIIDTPFDDAFSVITGRASGNDDDSGTILTFGIAGGQDQGATFEKAGLYGTLSVNKSTGVLSFMPDDAAVNKASTRLEEFYEVTVSDGMAQTVQSVKVIVQGSQEAPNVEDVSVITDEDNVAIRNLSAGQNSDAQWSYALISGATHGTVVLNPDGSYTYTPAANYSGTDSFTFKASDGTLDSNTATVSITVTPVNDTPVLANALADRSVTLGSSLNFAFAGNTFTDVDSPSLTYTAKLANGTALPSWLSFNPTTRTFSGTPTAADLGTLTVKVTASDGALSVADAFDLVISERPNTSPTGSNAAVSTKEDTPLTGALPGATDAEGDPVTYAKASDPAKGTVSVNPSGAFTYTPAANANGADSFTYTVTDDRGASSTYTVSLTINPVNDAPVITPLAPLVFVDTAQSDVFVLEQAGQIQAQDIDSASLSYRISGGTNVGAYSTVQGTYGSLQVHTGTGAYTFFANNAAIQALKSNASETFTLTVSDGALTAEAPMTVQIRGANDAPVLIAPLSDQTAYDAAAWSLTLSGAQFSDADTGDVLTYTATLANGAALPTWLSFDPATRMFSGTPSAADVGSLSIRVSASDGSLSASDVFSLVVNEYFEPVVDDSSVATYARSANQYTIRFDPVSKDLLVTDTDPQQYEVRKFTNAKRIEFADLTLNLAVSDLADTIAEPALNRIAELYVAFFNRVPDGDGMEFWLGQYRQGKTINDIADAFYNAGVYFSDLTGYRADMSNDDFIHIVYRNVLGRPEGADQEGLAFWRTELDSGRSAKGTLVSSILDAAHGSTFSEPTNPYHWVQKLLDNKLEVAKQVSVDWGVNYNSSEDSIAKGQAIAASITPDDTSMAISLVGVVVADMV